MCILFFSQQKHFINVRKTRSVLFQVAEPSFANFDAFFVVLILRIVLTVFKILLAIIISKHMDR